MTDIDHAAEALRLVSRENTSDALYEDALQNITQANIHAQLAIAEQQRIANDHAELANRLAYLSIKRSVPSEHHDWIEEELGL